MRKLTVRDLLTTLIIAAVVVLFAGYPVRGSMPFVQDPRGMARVGIMGALLAFDVPGNALPVEAISHGAGPGGKLAGASSVPVVARPDGAVAVLLDATIVRALRLPATMKLPGR